MTALPLTSGALIGLMAGASAVLITATFGTWRRLARPGARHLLARLGLLVATNLVLTSMIFLAVNRVFGFYISWSELLGTSTSTGVVRAGPGSPTAAPGTADGQGTPASPGPGSGPRPASAGANGRFVRVLNSQGLVSGQEPAGRLQRVRVSGERSGLSAYGYVYLPPQYPGSQQQFPVVVVISDSIAAAPPASGSAGGAGQAGQAGQLALTAYAQAAEGRAVPTIYVMLPATVAPGDQACLDVPGGPQAGIFFSQDVPAAVQGAYLLPGNPAGWGLLGDASGGYCAVRLAMTSSDRFTAAAAPAGDYRTPPGVQGPGGGQAGGGQPGGGQAGGGQPGGGQPGSGQAGGGQPGSGQGGSGAAGRPARSGPPPVPWLFGGSAQIRDEADLLWRLRQQPPQPVTVLFTGADAASLDTSRAFIAAVRPPMKAQTVLLGRGSQRLAPVVDRMGGELAWG